MTVDVDTCVPRGRLRTALKAARDAIQSGDVVYKQDIWPDCIIGITYRITTDKSLPLTKQYSTVRELMCEAFHDEDAVLRCMQFVGLISSWPDTYYDEFMDLKTSKLNALTLGATQKLKDTDQKLRDLAALRINHYLAIGE